MAADWPMPGEFTQYDAASTQADLYNEFHIMYQIPDRHIRPFYKAYISFYHSQSSHTYARPVNTRTYISMCSMIRVAMVRIYGLRWYKDRNEQRKRQIT